MQRSGFVVLAAVMAGACALTSLAMAQAPAAQAPAAPNKGEISSSVQLTAIVTKLDQATREVTLRTDDGMAYSFVASDAVRNLSLVKIGDRVTVTYAEALAYEVKKGGTTVAAASTVAGARAPVGGQPAAVVAGQTTVTVKITAIDHAVPSVTFVGPKGNSMTVKVRDRAKLEGVNVGDTVELTYTEAIAVKVDEVVKK